MLDRKFIGYEFDATEEEITPWKVSHFANAIRDNNPIYYDVRVAKEQGHKNLAVPPTYFTRMTFSGGGGGAGFFAQLGIDYRKLLDGGRECQYIGNYCAGDIIVYQTKVENMVEKEGQRGKMDIVTAVTNGKIKATGEQVFKILITLVVFH